MVTADGGDAAELAKLEQSYELLGELSRDERVTVYVARERSSGKEVAIKVLRAAHAHGRESLAHYASDARMLTALQHPNIIGVHALKWLSEDVVAVVTERVRGPSLRQVLDVAGTLPVARATEVLRGLGRALAWAHSSQIIHRDMRPENVIFEDRTGRVVLSDFGLARRVENVPGPGEPDPYHAPELADGRYPDRRSDVYSLGVIGWELLTGRRPWPDDMEPLAQRERAPDPPPLAEVRPGLPPALVAAIEGAVQLERDRRIPDVVTFMERLTAVAPPTPEETEAEQQHAPDEDISAGAPLEWIALPVPRMPARTRPRVSDQEITRPVAAEQPASDKDATVEPSAPTATTDGQPRAKRPGTKPEVAAAPLMGTMGAASAAAAAASSIAPSAAPAQKPRTERQPSQTTRRSGGARPPARPEAAGPERVTAPADVPLADAPRAGATPGADTPRADTPRADTPRADTPRADTSPADMRPADMPQTSAWSTSASLGGGSVVDVPLADRPPAPDEQSRSGGVSNTPADVEREPMERWSAPLRDVELPPPEPVPFADTRPEPISGPITGPVRTHGHPPDRLETGMRGGLGTPRPPKLRGSKKREKKQSSTDTPAPVLQPMWDTPVEFPLPAMPDPRPTPAHGIPAPADGRRFPLTRRGITIAAVVIAALIGALTLARLERAPDSTAQLMRPETPTGYGGDVVLERAKTDSAVVRGPASATPAPSARSPSTGSASAPRTTDAPPARAAVPTDSSRQPAPAATTNPANRSGAAPARPSSTEPAATRPPSRSATPVQPAPSPPASTRDTRRAESAAAAVPTAERTATAVTATDETVADDASAGPCASAALADQRACLTAHLARSDADLNQTYGDVIVAMRRRASSAPGDPDPPEVQRLRALQRSWLSRRDAECRRRGRGREGRLWATARARCLGEFSAERNRELSVMLARLRRE